MDKISKDLFNWNNRNDILTDAMDMVYSHRYDEVMEELTYSMHIETYAREPPRKGKYEKVTFVFNLYNHHGYIFPYYKCFVNFARQIGYPDSRYCGSDEVRDAQEFFVEKCKNQECYCYGNDHHSFEIDQDKVHRYFEMVIDIGNVVT